MQDLLGIGTNRRESMIGTGIGLGLAGYRLRTSFEAMPSLDLQFADRRMIQAALGPTPSFSRASTGTYFDSQGVLKSAAVNGPRFNHVYNGTSWVSRGLLVEEQRTNGNLYSEDFSNASWTKAGATIGVNVALSPDGTTTADKLIETVANQGHAAYSVVSNSAGSSHTLSVFSKSAGRSVLIIRSNLTGTFLNNSFDLASGTVQRVATGYSAKIENIGNDWYRCSVSATAASTGCLSIFCAYNGTLTSDADPAYLGDGTSGILLWGAQSEVGAFPTSYIPTTTASATRSADVCQITGVDFSNTWNPLEGSAVAEFDIFSSTSNTYIFHAFDASTRIPIGFFNDSSGFEMYTWNTAYQARFLYGSLTANTNHKAAYGYKENDFAGSLNGSATSTDTSGVIPAASTFLIGIYSGTNFINGHIARLRYYPTRLTNAKLQELST